MKIFSKRTDPLAATLEQLVERQVRLTAMRSQEQTALDVTLASRQSHLIAGDVDDPTMAEALQTRAEAARSALVGLDDAIAALSIQIADAEAAATSEQRRVQAEGHAKALTAVIAKVGDMLPEWLATAREMSESLGSLNNFRYQVGGVANYLGGVAAETEAGLRVVLDDLSAAIPAVANGTQQITIGKAQPTPAIAIAPAVPPKDHFTYRTSGQGPTYRVPNENGQ